MSYFIQYTKNKRLKYCILTADCKKLINFNLKPSLSDIADTDNEPENNISIEDLHLKRLDGFEVKVVLNQNDRDNLDYIIDLSDYRKSKDLSKIKVIRTRARNPKLTCVYLLNGKYQ